MGGCCAVRCSNSSSGGYRMYRFPKDPVLRDAWVSAMCRKNWIPTSNSRLCHEHFDEGREGLKPTTVPTKFCSCIAADVVKLPYPDHTYCKQASHHDTCYKSTAFRVLSENCVLKNQIVSLSKKLQEKEEKENRTLAAFTMMNQATTDSTEKSYDGEEIKKGLKLRFACGTTGYNSCSELTGNKLPSVRTLQRKTEHIAFNPGIQDDIIEGLGEKIKATTDVRQRDTCLIFDAMAIKPHLDFDIGNKSYLGRVTLPGVPTDEMAPKAEVWMLGALFQRWKQVLAYHFVPNCEYPEAKKQVILDLLKKCHDNGLNVVTLVCDMGNRGLLKTLGFSTTKNKMIYCIPNPVDPSSKLWISPDVIHLFKSLKEMFCANPVLLLSDAIVREFNLPSNEVHLSHIEWLEEYQRGEDLKFVPKLKLKDIHTPHFSKMRVKSAYAMLNHQTASAMDYLPDKKIVPEAFRTTAWFVKLVDRWREIMTSRTLVNALSKRNKEAYDKSIGHLRLVIRVFNALHVKNGPWKPVQTHVVIATEAMLEIQDYLLNERGYDFLFLARFLQDIIENLFSVIRMQRPVPTPCEFKYRLKQCCLSQFMREIKNSSYDYAGVTDDFVDILLDGFRKEALKKEKVSVPITDFIWCDSVPNGAFAVGQEDILYRVSGYVVKSMIGQSIITCGECIEKLRHHGPDPHPNSALVKKTNFKENAQFEVSNELFQMLRLVEYNIRKWKNALIKTTDCLESLILNRIIPSLSFSQLSTCHDLKNKILSKFSWMRLKQLSVSMSDILVKPNDTASHLSSKTAGSKFLAERFTLNRLKNMPPP